MTRRPLFGRCDEWGECVGADFCFRIPSSRDFQRKHSLLSARAQLLTSLSRSSKTFTLLATHPVPPALRHHVIPLPAASQAASDTGGSVPRIGPRQPPRITAPSTADRKPRQQPGDLTRRTAVAQMMITWKEPGILVRQAHHHCFSPNLSASARCRAGRTGSRHGLHHLTSASEKVLSKKSSASCRFATRTQPCRPWGIEWSLKATMALEHALLSRPSPHLPGHSARSTTQLGLRVKRICRPDCRPRRRKRAGNSVAT